MPSPDRLVKVVNAGIGASDEPKPFSEYRDVPNIVLLGDPGAGKSHLFSSFAAIEGCKALVARSFLNLPSEELEGSPGLFIDALDERRAGRGDDSAIDEMVRKLFLVRPHKVRIACRVADWLGETDLAAFSTYFERSGGHLVLNLLPLSTQERIAVLNTQCIEDPVSFLAEATDRGLEDLLGNPQNLMMLAEVVMKRTWPSTRMELFRLAVEILLEEHNDRQRSRPAGRYSPGDLREMAGRLCALRLVSDVLAISLTENDRGSDLPSYRSICPGDTDRALAALSRRAFVVGFASESVDYAHRTIAEYLGAEWIAGRVRHGLPVGRVRSLLGIDGRPASELRGLHAWLVMHLPEHARGLIDADPYGVLSYADAKALSPPLRRCLLESLAKLADSDPWFRDIQSSRSSVAGLSGPDLVSEFRSILSSRNAGFSLRMLVLDSLSAGYVATELVSDLEALITDSSAPYVEREASVDVLLRMGSRGELALRVSYPRLGKSDDELRLRSRLLRNVYAIGLRARDVVELYRDALSPSVRNLIGRVWRVAEGLNQQDVLEVLDRLSEISVEGAHTGEECSSDVLREYDVLLSRALALNRDLAGDRLLAWLELRRQIAGQISYGQLEGLGRLLGSDLMAINKAVDAAIEKLVGEKSSWGFVNYLHELTGFGATDSSILERIVFALHREESPHKRPILYDLALIAVLRVGPTAQNSFDALVDFAEGDSSLEPIRAGNCVVEIQDWRLRDARRRREHAGKVSERRAKNRSDFGMQRELIQSGGHLAWLAWISQVYFSLYSDLDIEATPRERLAVELGDRGADEAIEGLVNFVRRGEAPGLDEIFRMRSKEQHFAWWYSLLAGLEEYTQKGEDIRAFPDEFLKSVLIIECSHSVFIWKDGVWTQRCPQWKLTLFRSRPEFVAATYAALARFDLSNGAEHIGGLTSVLDEENLQPYRSSIALALLREYPCAPSQSLTKLLRVAISDCQSDEVSALAASVLAEGRCGAEVSALWSAAAFLVGSDSGFVAQERLNPEIAVALVWALRDLSGSVRDPLGGVSALPVHKIEQIVRLAMTAYSKTAHPDEAWGGDRNPWDATNYSLKLLAVLSADASSESAKVLARLVNEPSASSYVSDIKHAIAQQHMRLVDMSFRQPSLAETVSVFDSGVPISVADLHALMIQHIRDIGLRISGENIDVYKRFWNEDDHGRVEKPKVEESCRDYLIELLRARVGAAGIVLEPEGHMVADKRADIVVHRPGMKLVLELKRDYHRELWTSLQNQLERLYTRDPDTQGYGIYCVFWFGANRGYSIPASPVSTAPPLSAEDMERQLESLVAPPRRNKIAVVVLDVSGEVPQIQKDGAVVGQRTQRPARIKYRDKDGNTWVGRGRRPHWLTKAIDEGAQLSDFEVT